MLGLSLQAIRLAAADAPTIRLPSYPSSPGCAVPDGGFECSQDWWALERGVYL